MSLAKVILNHFLTPTLSFQSKKYKKPSYEGFLYFRQHFVCCLYIIGFLRERSLVLFPCCNTVFIPFFRHNNVLLCNTWSIYVRTCINYIIYYSTFRFAQGELVSETSLRVLTVATRSGVVSDLILTVLLRLSSVTLCTLVQIVPMSLHAAACGNIVMLLYSHIPRRGVFFVTIVE
jgi:hypothetical protein